MMRELREFEASLNGPTLKRWFDLRMLTCNPRLLKAWMTDKAAYQAACAEPDHGWCFIRQSTIILARMFHDDLTPSQRVKFRSLCEAYFRGRFR